MCLWTRRVVYLHRNLLMNDSGKYLQPELRLAHLLLETCSEIEFRASKWLIMIMDSQPSPHIRANLKFSYLIPICLIWSCVSCTLPAVVQRYAAALTHFHPPWTTGTDTRLQTVLIGCGLVTGAACRPRLSKGTPACSLWILKCHVWAHTGLL